MTSGVIYARLSDVRKGDVEGIDRQVREAKALAERLDVEVVEVLIDNDITAADRRKKRPAFQRLMEGMAANDWNFVILRSLERWVRQPAELEQIIEVAETSKVRVESVHAGQIDLRTRQGRLLARMMTAVAMDEIEAVRERVTDWHADRAARGLPSVGVPGYGFNADKVSINEPEAERIREAAERVLLGEALASIARDWNDQGVPAPRGSWRPQTIHRILIAPRTAGLRVSKGLVVGEAVWSPILDRVTYQRVVARLTDPERRRNSPKDRRAKLLTGIATCGRCRHTLNSSVSKGSRRYKCHGCHGVTILAEPFERLAVDLGRRRVPRVDAYESVDDQAVRDEIEACDRKLDELAKEWAADRLTRHEWLTAGELLRERLREASTHLSRTMEVVRPVDWDSNDVAELRRGLLDLLEDVVVAPAVRGSNRFDSKRLTWEWRN